MDKHAAALIIEEIGTLMELQGENPFRARAFYNAARALEQVEGEFDALVAEGKLEQVRGFGPATIAVARELAETGASSVHHELRSRTPDGLFDLLRIPGLGAKRVHLLHTQLGVESLDDLERAAEEDRIASLPGFGQRTQAKLLEGIAYLRSQMGRSRQPEAWAIAAALTEFLSARAGVVRVEIAGELRRRLETVRGVDVVAVVSEQAAPVITAFLEIPGARGGERVGASGARVRLGDGIEARLTCVPPDAFAAALLYATGSDAHVAAVVARAEAQGYRLNEFGLWRGEERVPVSDEATLYRVLGLDYIEPELREAGFEVALAAEGGLPTLVALTDLRGCFHCHTSYSDGRASLTEMAMAAKARGWRYLGIADHSRAAAYAGGLSVEQIERQHAEIDAWNAEHGHELWLFKGMETDILPDGRLDYADEEDVLGRFDYVVGSVHSSFSLSEAEMTQRIIRAMEDPHLTLLGHPTGRLLLGREGYPIDMDAVIDAAADAGVGIEINANPNRLDMDWRHWRRAKERGILTAINPDAHSTQGLGDVEYGIGVARKGWLTAADVINTWPLDEVRRHFAEGRRR